jgi:hypothetical protein
LQLPPHRNTHSLVRAEIVFATAEPHRQHAHKALALLEHALKTGGDRVAQWFSQAPRLAIVSSLRAYHNSTAASQQKVRYYAVCFF